MPLYVASYVSDYCMNYYFPIYIEMAAHESHNINRIKVAIFCCIIILCGIVYYAYNMYSAHSDPIESQLDDIKVHHKDKQYSVSSSKAQKHYESINI